MNSNLATFLRTIVLSVFFMGEKLTRKVSIGGLLVGLGAVLMAV